MWGNGIKLSPVAKFVIQRCDLQELREFLCIIFQKSVPIYMRKDILETQMMRTLCIIQFLYIMYIVLSPYT
jgi:hypothetical protein